MNWKMIYTSAFLLLSGFLLINNSNGRATVANEGNTGAPGDVAIDGRTCQNCHNSASIQVTLDIDVTDLDENPVSTYIPNNTYLVHVTVNPVVGTPSRYGFQLVSEIDSNNESTKSFSNPSSNAKLVNTSNGRQYAEHKVPSDTNVFIVQWTAPELGTGDVTFYSGGNGVNFNEESSGDGAAVASFTLAEEAGAWVVEPANQVTLAVAPNPALESIQLMGGSALDGAYLLRVLDLTGRIAMQQTGFSVSGAFPQPVSVGQLPSGVYLIQLLNGRQTASATFYKL
ncbi:MAG: hypothetical protein IPL49_04225 [Saprospirales bacterium]|nr:hypothetical protein [Saprospirales bacterium]MBK8490121.1 hypothetical protein [Saprospirales bacterium]